MPADWGKPDQVISLSTKPGLKYDKNLMQVKAGAKVKLVFNNNDDMTHNVVITLPVRQTMSRTWRLILV
jgi:plastocyanin